MVDFLFLDDAPIDDAAFAKAMATPSAAEILTDTIGALETAEWDHEVLHDTVLAIGEGYGLKLGKTQAPIRVAITGRSVGPPLFEAIVLLGRDESIRRLRSALERHGSASA